MDQHLLGGLSPERFLEEYWQKKPLLVRGAFPNFKSLLSADELGGMAMAEEVESRLVTRGRGVRSYKLEQGPFSEERLTELPQRAWSLLVQHVNRHLDSAAELLDRFNFIPNWRADDLMISFAPEGGGVGPHIDSYDVFLIQGEGRRRWSVESNPDPRLVAGVPLKILSRFEPDNSWIMEPGDMLYVPPGVAHDGISLEPGGMTYSVGFRAPAVRELRSSFFRLPEALLGGEGLYADPDLAPATAPGEIDAAAVERVRRLFADVLNDDVLLARWLACHVTSPSPLPELVPDDGVRLGQMRSASINSIEKALASATVVLRHDGLRLAFVRDSSADRIHLYADGDELTLPGALAPMVELLTATHSINPAKLRACLPRAATSRRAGLALLAALRSLNILSFSRRRV